MRALLASSVGLLSVAALALPATAAAHPGAVADPLAPGATHSLPLTPVKAERGAAAAVGVTSRRVQPFSLLGVVWDDAATPLHGDVQVRTRSVGTGEWSAWKRLDTHAHDGPDTRSARTGATAPLWTGPSDGVQARLRPTGGRLPEGLRLELVDPGESPQAEDSSRSGGLPLAEQAVLEDRAVVPALNRAETRAVAEAEETERAAPGAGKAVSHPYIGPRPAIVTRKGWGADESLREREFAYGKPVKMAFVHHTAGTNDYRCDEAPALIRSIYRYHVRTSGWRDIGYNFLIDRCGTIYEGRAGGLTQPVQGAHTYGYNSGSTGIAVLGSYGSKKPPKAVADAVSALTAWKLGLTDVDPRAKASMTSGGKTKRLRTISGHRDGFSTECPGALLYGKLGAFRETSARLQGR